MVFHGRIFGIIRAAIFGALVLGILPGAMGQRGDRGDARAKMKLPESVQALKSPVVPPEKALDTFELREGFRIELVAAEPLVNRPVDIAWDAEGRLWVAEMTEYMPDADAKGETEPVGTIAVLEDTDGDSIMDKRTVFLDGLVLPRTVAPAAGGVLVGAPPSLLWCKDTDGDLVCDEKVVVDSKYGAVNGNVEHMTNVLRPQRDNWFIMGKDDRQYRFRNGAWETGKGKGLGQWGISPDDWGNVYYNSNSRLLSVNGQNIGSNRVNPIRPTPGVNRGYGWISKSDRLNSVTAACGPGVYRGGVFPEGYEGNVYACAPCVNTVVRFVVEEKDGKIRGENGAKESDFLASTDERFRPVNIRTGPDGGLYIVDMYHGILQHRTYMTTWLRQQVEGRGLDAPMGTGRIYRILPEGVKPGPRPELGKAKAGELVALLEHKNGWWRDTAQRLLVEGGMKEAAPALKKMAMESGDARARFHALWALEGIGAADAEVLKVAMGADEAKIREAGLRIALDSGAGDGVADVLVGLLGDEDAFVRASAAKKLAGAESEALKAAFGKVLSETESGEVLKAAAEAMEGDEMEVLKARMGDPNWGTDGGTKGRVDFLKEMARRVVDRGRPAECGEMVNLLENGDKTLWKGRAIFEGAISSRRAKDKKLKPVRLASVPRFLDGLEEKEKTAMGAVFVWPGQPGFVVAEAKDFKLDEAQMARLNEGKTLFNVVCGVCHKADGTGQEGLASPLVGSEWVEGSYDHMLRITLNGVKGPIEVAGKKYELEMPPLGALGDAQLAAALSYVQREFGDATMAPLEQADVKAMREASKGRKGPWTAAELERELVRAGDGEKPLRGGDGR